MNLEKQIKTSQHFEFNQWEVCFKVFNERVASGENIRLVISRHLYSAGYWIEYPITELSIYDTAYSGQAAIDLQNNVRKEIELANKENRFPKFIQ